MKKLLSYLAILALIFVALTMPDSTWAQELTFQDEFNVERADNTLDFTNWNLTTNANNFATVKESQGFVNLSQQPNTRLFPYAVSKNKFPDGDFSAEVKFQYTGISAWGSGLGFSDAPPDDPSESLIIGVWQDRQPPPSTAPNMRVSFAEKILKGLEVNIESHILKIDYKQGVYTVFFDGTQIHQTPSNKKIKYFWMGSPYMEVSNIPYWTTFKVDYVRVESVPSSPISSHTPLIFIPGFGGSELKVAEKTDWVESDGHGGLFANTYQKDEKVWVNELEAAKPGSDDYFDILKLKQDGKTDMANLSLTGDLYKGSYQKIIDFLVDKGYEVNKDLFVFPYDFRKDIALASEQLGKRIDEIKQKTGNQKVDLVAHSMGGLVARSYIADANKAVNVRKLITLGTPYLGTGEALQKIMYGGCLSKFPFSISPVCLGLSSSEVKDVLQNSSGIYQLAPSQNYYNFYDGSDNTHPVPFKDARDIDNDKITGDLNYSQTKTLLSNLHYNSELYNFNEALHSSDSNFNTNGVETSLIIGSGQPTVGQIVERNLVDFMGVKIPKKDLIMINGDGTTPLYSGSLNDSTKSLSMNGSAKVYYAKLLHESLVNDSQSLNLVENILEGKIETPAGITTTPYQLNGTLLSVHSPVTLDIYDQNSNHTGINGSGDIEENIPGSIYTTLDDAKFIWLPEDGKYTVKFAATDQGSFDYKIRTFENDKNEKEIFFENIPLTISTKAEENLDTTSPDPQSLQLDENGDGTVDKNILPKGSMPEDKTPPEAKISFNQQTQNVEITGEDESGSVAINDLGDGQFVIKDPAGNTITLVTDIKDKKKRDKIVIQSLAYNQDPQTSPTDNRLVVTYKLDKDNKIKQFDQTIVIKGDERSKAFYDPKTNKTRIVTKEKGQDKNIEFKEGTILLVLRTQKGDLIASF